MSPRKSAFMSPSKSRRCQRGLHAPWANGHRHPLADTPRRASVHWGQAPDDPLATPRSRPQARAEAIDDPGTPLGQDKGETMTRRLTHRPSHRLTHRLTGLVARRRDVGMTTAEYAVGIMAACTFALVLLGVVKSDAVRSTLAGIVQSALGIAG